MYIVNTFPVSTVKFNFSEIICYTSVITEGVQHWLKHRAFVFPGINSQFGNCQKNERKGVYTCHVSSYDMNVSPSRRWLTFGYLCDSQKKSLYGLKYSYSAAVRNTTLCEPLSIQEQKIPYLNCEKYYNYMSLPNIYGDRSLSEAIRSIQLLFTVVKNMKTPCYKYLDYAICQAFLPRCPTDKLIGKSSLTNNTSTVSHLVPLCQEMCWDLWHSCKTELDPLLDYVNCFYYKPKENITFCIHMEVYCEPPHEIINGKMDADKKQKYPVGTSVEYTCNEDFRLKGNKSVACGFSGTWSTLPYCETVLFFWDLRHILAIMLVLFFYRIFISKENYRSWNPNSTC